MSERGRLVVDGRDVASVEVATTARERTRGLLGREGLDGALLLRPATSVHTMRMNFPIDVAFVNGEGDVLATVTMARNRLGAPRLRSRAILEAEAGSFEQWGLAPGCSVEVLTGSGA